MRVLLDECMPRKLRRELPGCEVRTVTEVGWGGTTNGALLRRAAGEFDVLLTADSNLEYQQNTSALPIAVIVLLAFSNDIDVLRPLMPHVWELLPTIERGRLYRAERRRRAVHLSRCSATLRCSAFGPVRYRPGAGSLGGLDGLLVGSFRNSSRM